MIQMIPGSAAGPPVAKLMFLEDKGGPLSFPSITGIFIVMKSCVRYSCCALGCLPVFI